MRVRPPSERGTIETGKEYMETLHTRVYIIGRSQKSKKQRGSASAASAYVSGSIVAAAAYRAHDRLTQTADGKVHDYTKKRGIVHTQIMLPENAPERFADRSTLWNEVEAVEKRKDAQLARQYQAALPAEFSGEEQLRLIQEFIKDNFVERGMIADFAIHDKNDGNPHFHCLLTTRHVTKSGFGNKNREWEDFQRDKRKRSLYKSIRYDFAVRCNRLYQQKGMPDRIDPRKCAEQGKAYEPTVHLGKDANQLEKKGIRTELGDENRRILAQREPTQNPEIQPMQTHVLYTAPDEIPLTRQPVPEPATGEDGIPDGEIFDAVPSVLKTAKKIERVMQQTDQKIIQPISRQVDGILEDVGTVIDEQASNVIGDQQQPIVGRSELQAQIRQLRGRAQSVSRIEANIAALDQKIERLSIQLEAAGFSQARAIERQIKDTVSARNQACTTLVARYQVQPDEIKDHLRGLEQQIERQQQVYDTLPLPELPQQEKGRERSKTKSRSR